MSIERLINLMEALRRSVSEDEEQAPPRRGAPAAPARVAPPCRNATRCPAAVGGYRAQRRPARPMIHPSSAMGSRSHERTR